MCTAPKKFGFKVLDIFSYALFYLKDKGHGGRDVKMGPFFA